MTVKLSPADRVARGAMLLDLLNQRWDTFVDTKTLNITSTQSCVLAQLYGHYDEGADTLGITREMAINYAFYPAGRFARIDNFRMNRQWKKLIKQRAKVRPQARPQLRGQEITGSITDELHSRPLMPV